MQEAFTVSSDIGEKLDHVLKISFGFHTFRYIRSCGFHLVLTHGVLYDSLLLHGIHKSVVDTERNTVSVGYLGEHCLFLCGGGIFSYRPHTSVAVAYDIVVVHEFYRAWRNAIEVVLCSYEFELFGGELLSHLLRPPVLIFQY